MLAKVAGRVRGFFAGNYPENREDEQLILNNRGDLVVTQSMPELTEIVRLGQSYQVITGAATAPVAGLPTTTAGLSIQNGEPANGLSYVIDSIAVVEIVVDATQQNETALMAMMNAANSAAPSAGTQIASATAIRSLSGRGGYSGRAIVRSGATVTNDGWFPHGTSAPGAAAVAGGAWRVTDVPIRGLYIVPPLGSFSIQSAKLVATAAQCLHIIRWHEAQLIVKT